MSVSAEARKAGDWTIINAIRIGALEVVFGVNRDNPAAARYLCAFCQTNGLFAGYSECMSGDDYLEIMELYLDRARAQLEKARDEISQVTVPLSPIQPDQCYPNDLSKSIGGKVVAIRADVLLPEYQTANNQLVLVDGGFGAHANSRGSAVYAYNLYTGKHSRYERRDVLGEVKPEHIPSWAMEREKTLRKKIKRRSEPER